MASKSAPAFTLAAEHTAVLSGILAGTTHVGKSDEVTALVDNGYIEVNTSMLDSAGNAAVRLTDKGTEAAKASSPATGSGTASGVSFVIATNVSLPGIKRGGGGNRESKYPLKDIPVGGALFIPAAEGEKPKSKAFGSMVTEFNGKVEDRHITTRTIRDGKEAGFEGRNADGTPNPDLYAGVAGIGLYALAGKAPVKEAKAAE